MTTAAPWTTSVTNKFEKQRSLTRRVGEGADPERVRRDLSQAMEEARHNDDQGDDPEIIRRVRSRC